jgi:hypothetical protein
MPPELDSMPRVADDFYVPPSPSDPDEDPEDEYDYERVAGSDGHYYYDPTVQDSLINEANILGRKMWAQAPILGGWLKSEAKKFPFRLAKAGVAAGKAFVEEPFESLDLTAKDIKNGKNGKKKKGKKGKKTKREIKGKGKARDGEDADDEGTDDASWNKRGVLSSDEVEDASESDDHESASEVDSYIPVPHTKEENKYADQLRDLFEERYDGRMAKPGKRHPSDKYVD